MSYTMKIEVPGKAATSQVKVLFADFRKAIRNGSIDAATAKRIFSSHFKRLGEICKSENCSIERARTINAALECDIDCAFRREGKPGFLKAYDSVETLLEDLK